MARPGFVWDGSGVAAGSALALASMPVFVVFDPPPLVDGRSALARNRFVRFFYACVLHPPRDCLHDRPRHNDIIRPARLPGPECS